MIVQRISTLVFVTNFSEYACAKDLWNACKQYGYVVDAFISNRRSKAGKKFGFVHFIKVFDVERLVNNLCTVWIGRHRIHANVAKFHRPTGLNRSKAYWVCAKKIPGWTPDFDEHNDEDSDSDDEQFEGVFKEDIGRSDEEVQGKT
ncbi:DIE2/ALG10 family protein, partial [Tanacetum coccineum]